MAGNLIEFRTFASFNSKEVIDAVDKVKRQNLSRAGAFIRQRAKSLIRKRKAISKPGHPPSSHEGSLRRLIVFGYDRSNESVVVGPLRFPSKSKNQTSHGIPNVLEFGGVEHRGGKTLHYKKRAFMAPALEAEAEAGTLDNVWRNSVR